MLACVSPCMRSACVLNFETKTFKNFLNRFKSVGIDFKRRTFVQQYKPVYFRLKELVHPNIYLQNDPTTLWKVFDPQLLMYADRVRIVTGEPVICNSANRGLLNCGLRCRDDSNFPLWDPHKFGRALDLHVPSIDVATVDGEKHRIEKYNELRQRLINIHYGYLDVCFEADIPYLHFDTYNRQSSGNMFHNFANIKKEE